jgi:hypothetical protein
MLKSKEHGEESTDFLNILLEKHSETLKLTPIETVA